MSHLLQMRGLKPTLSSISYVSSSRIFYRCVDWNLRHRCLKLGLVRRIFYRCVDWNGSIGAGRRQKRGRIFYRCVDWNKRTKHDKIAQRGSHLLQMRGLKPLQAYSEGKPLESHLLQMRGLKLLITPKNISLLLVASFTDAWIETVTRQYCEKSTTVASFTDAWIETPKVVLYLNPVWGRIFYRCVDWNSSR